LSYQSRTYILIISDVNVVWRLRICVGIRIKNLWFRLSGFWEWGLTETFKFEKL
jgi:hypothetical protein